MIKGDRIFWDLDGVLRKLSHGFNGTDYPNSWWEKDSNGKNICEYIDEDLTMLLECPEENYIEVAKECLPLHIVSLQPDNWRKNTSKWLDIHLPDAHVKYVTKPDHKLLYLECGTRILIEDSPNFDDYSQIILIDRPYNAHVDAPHRVKSPDELRDKLRKYLTEGKLC